MKKKTPKKPGPKRQDRTRTETIAFKCYPEYKQWLAEIAESNRVTPSQCIDMALSSLAARQAFKPPPKR